MFLRLMNFEDEPNMYGSQELSRFAKLTRPGTETLEQEQLQN